MKTIVLRSVTLFALLAFASPALAQVQVGVDVMSRYVWRGFDFGNSPSIQPTLAYTSGGFEVGTWAAMATTGNPDGSEIDFFASYGFDTGSGTLSFLVTDYTFPESPAGNYFSSDAHFIEGGIAYEGPDSFPISLFAGMFLHNDDDNSIYAELGYAADPFELFVGMTPHANSMYGTSKAGIINAGVSASRQLNISDGFSLTLSTALITNPYFEQAHLLFGISL